jgi:hypothetical protein
MVSSFCTYHTTGLDVYSLIGASEGLNLPVAFELKAVLFKRIYQTRFIWRLQTQIKVIRINSL